MSETKVVTSCPVNPVLQCKGECLEPSFSMGLNTLKIPMSLHKKNRDRLLEKFRNVEQNSIIIVEGGPSITRYCTDNEPLFRQESYFHWLFGTVEPDMFGSIHVGTGKSSLFIPRLPESYAVWMGEIKSPEHFKNHYGVDEVLYLDDMEKNLADVKTLWLLEGLNSDSNNKSKPASHESINKFQGVVDKVKLHEEMSLLRSVKTPEEIEVMRYAIKVSSAAHVEVMRQCKPGMTEYQLESIFRHHCYYEGGCRNQGYTCICGSGINSSVLHYGHAAAPNDKVINDGDMLLMDMGSEYHCYGADITCSYPANGKFTPEQKDIYSAVLAAQKAVFKELKAGVQWTEMHRKAERAMLSELKNRGYLQGDVDDMMKHYIGSKFQPHGLGHLLGLDTHDVGGYPKGVERIDEPGLRSLRMGRRCEAGMILTVEPGCYFIPVVLKPALEDPQISHFFVKERILALLSFGGVRLEDDVLVTADGHINLTEVPREIEDIEAVMAGAPWPRSSN